MKRHKWVYVETYDLAREKTPARCACGAMMFYVQRKKKPVGMGNAHIYGTMTEDEIVVTADGVRHVNEKPRPGCTR